MCGVAGFWSQSGRLSDPSGALDGMVEALRHRGPDGEGSWFDDRSGIALGHRRLAVVDLSELGRQPMVSAGGRFHLVYNGEIYNFVPLREELRSAGAEFRGRSDTEVMLAAFEHWGVERAVSRFAGMFAFALWDAHQRRLYLVRDRLGEKPLYYGWHGGVLLFGSELHALSRFPGFQPGIDPGALALYLRHGCVPAPYAIWTGFRKVAPGTIRIASEDRPGAELEEVRYWSPEQAVEAGERNPLLVPEPELIEQTESLLSRVIAREMIADVPLGAFLSGGVDSSLIVALMQRQSARPVRTFTIGFREAGYDEAGFAREVAARLGTEHVELYVTGQDALAVVPRMAEIYDEPFADPSQIPTFLVARLAREHVTVSLSGDGGDELFGGYAHYQRVERLWPMMRRWPRRIRGTLGVGLRNRAGAWTARGNGHEALHRIARVGGLLDATSPGDLLRGIMSHCAEPGDFLPGAVEPPTAFTTPARRPRTASLLHGLMHLDMVSFLPDDILVKVDRATMAVSLESRAPFLDHEVAEFAWRLPVSVKVRNGQGKWILRQILRRHLPEHLAARPKAGFASPIGTWLSGPLHDWVEDLLAPDRLRRQGLLDPVAVGRVRTARRRGIRQWDAVIWNLVMLQSWLEAGSTAPASAVPA